MRTFRIKRERCEAEPHPNCVVAQYTVGGHSFEKPLFERLTGLKWEHGHRTFKLVEVRPRTKRGGTRGLTPQKGRK